MASTSPYLFISYRREDTLWIARDLYRHLSSAFGPNRVFMDRVEIRGGDDWKHSIDEALQKSTVILALIGKQWLTLDDSNGRPRIDNKNDWVRKEIQFAIKNGTRLLAMYVDGATPIRDPHKLPPSIRAMLDKQQITLPEDIWEGALRELIRKLGEFGLKSHNASFPLPSSRKRVDALTAQELELLGETLPGWTVMTSAFSTGTGAPPVARTELYRSYTFSSFKVAVAFMAFASDKVDATNHHPRWENIWTSVRVWLSTWDIEFQPSHFDVELALLLDQIFDDFCKISK